MKLLAAATLAALVLVGAASGEPPRLIVGVTEDGLRFEPAAVARDARPLGIGAVRITLGWRPGRNRLTPEQRRELTRATSVEGLRVVLSVFGERAVYAPTTRAARAQYCDFARSVLAGFPRIGDIVVWNEPNKTFFWQPQFDAAGRSAAPAAYAALLARCWDVLHAQRDDVNMLGFSTAPRGNDDPDARSNISHSPVRFIERVGAAYRRSGRSRPLFDTVAHHVHGADPAERPWRRHPGRSVSQGDYARLVAALQRAFAGTDQAAPGRCAAGRCVPIWYLEAGFQTRPDGAKARLYTGAELPGLGVPDATGPVDLDPLPSERSPAPDQASQLVGALRLAACQPHVEAFFNFLLWDEARLEGWQSGLYWADRTPKASTAAFRETVADVEAGRVGCGKVRRQLPAPAETLGVPAATPAPTAPTTSAPIATPTSAATTTEPTTTEPTTEPSRPAETRSGGQTRAEDRGSAEDRRLVFLAAAVALALLAAAGLLRRRRGRRGISR
ncbi:MAG: hypothetical protein ABR583_12805 [Gaiellaceae bacterium]